MTQRVTQCRSVDWLTGASEGPCNTCGTGPCKLAFRYPLDEGTNPPQAEQVELDAMRRRITNPVQVFDGVVNGKRHVVYQGGCA